MNQTIHIPDESHLHACALELLNVVGDKKIIAFYGKMGAGKTTLIKAFLQELDIIDTVNSPTFAIVNEYNTAKNQSVFHFDFYRIKNIEEVYDLGYEDYFYSGHLCLIEWPEMIEDLLPENTTKVNIEVNHDESRTLTVFQ